MTVIDRFEDSVAVLETDDGMIDISRDLLPADAKEGDVLLRSGDGYSVDKQATEKRREEMRGRYNRLRRNRK